MSTSVLVRAIQQATADHPGRAVPPFAGNGGGRVAACRGGVDGIIMPTGRGEGLILALAGLVGAIGGCSIMMSAAAPAGMASTFVAVGVVAALLAVALLFWALKR